MIQQYRPHWIDGEAIATHVRSSTGFGSIWLIEFMADEPEQEEAFDASQEQDERELKEEAVSKSFKSRYLVVRGDWSEIWTSTPEEAASLLGVEQTLFSSVQ